MALVLLSFVVSVVCYMGDSISNLDPNQTYLAFGGSVMMYGLSQVIEVCMLLNPKNPFLKKLVVGAVFIIGLITTAHGVVHVFAPNKIGVENTFIICLIPVIIYIADFLLFYLVKTPEDLNEGQEDILKDVDVEV